MLNGGGKKSTYIWMMTINVPSHAQGVKVSSRGWFDGRVSITVTAHCEPRQARGRGGREEISLTHGPTINTGLPILDSCQCFMGTCVHAEVL